MPPASGRSLNLYNFFAIFLPGFLFIILLIPFSPQSIDIRTPLAAIPLIAVGFVIGQALHTISIIVQSLPAGNTTTTSHRELFVQAVDDQSEHSPKIPNPLISRFKTSVNDQHSGEDTGPLNTDNATSNDEIKSVYHLARSKIHADGRGRSRVFQSIYAFSRSVQVMILVVGVIYIVYAILDFVDISQAFASQSSLEFSVQIYTPLIASALEQPLVVIPLAILGMALGYGIFNKTTAQYKRNYVEYTLADYVVILNENPPPDLGKETHSSAGTGGGGGTGDSGDQQDASPTPDGKS